MIVRYENACGNRRTVLPTAGSDERKFTQRDRRDSAQGYSLSEAGYRRGIAAVVAVDGRWWRRRQRIDSRRGSALTTGAVRRGRGCGRARPNILVSLSRLSLLRPLYRRLVASLLLSRHVPHALSLDSRARDVTAVAAEDVDRLRSVGSASHANPRAR